MNYGVEERYEETLVSRPMIPSEAPPPYSLVTNEQQNVGTLGFVVQHEQQAAFPVNNPPTPGSHQLDDTNQLIPSHDPSRTDFFVHEEVKITLNRPEEDTTINSCCAMCCVESLNCGVKEQSDAMIRSFTIGGRGLFYSFFSNNPSCCGLKILGQLFMCLAVFVLFVLNLTILGLTLTSDEHASSTISALLAVNAVLPFLLLVYGLVDLIIHVRFLTRKNHIGSNGVVELYTLNSAYKANFARLIIPELILYPLVLTSLFSALFTNSLLFSSTGHDDGSSLPYLMTISFIISCILFALVVVVYRLYTYIHLAYSLRAATHGTLPRHSKGIPTILGLFIYYSFGLTVLQILVTIHAAKLGANNPYRIEWSVWYYMAYGCVCHVFGMMAVVLVNYRLIRGLCVELFFRVCSRIYHCIVLFPDNSQRLTGFYAVLDRVRPNSGYSTVGEALAHPFKNCLALITATLFGVASTCIAVNVLLAEETDVLGYVIIGVLCLVNVQTFLIALVVACVIALCILLVALFLLLLRFGSWRLCFLFSNDRVRY